MKECRRGCGRQIRLVQLATGKWHPVDLPLVKVPEGRVVYDEDKGEWSILDARLKREADGTINPRCGRAWPVDGGAYMSHMDSCRKVAEELQEQRRRMRRDEDGELVDPYEWEAPRCRVCLLPMDEGLAAGGRYADPGHPEFDGTYPPQFDHPSCAPEHRPPDPDEARRLTRRTVA